ncbi:hypothetical protein [Endozoicomonas sp. YOMI1]|uniref:hypothetical protein n=1 Tax=Endozoicomonas sp. YOMI1 TaxID=2828739 RepID=UPI002148D2E5|nr:hypothetical protein [Endozoicomonas sp. YOMI1]
MKSTPLTLDAARLLMDEAVSSNNFPAMWQLKSRYGITLSAAQLKEVLWHTLPRSFHVYVTPSAQNKVRMALDLMTHDDASKRVVCDFLQEVLKKKGQPEIVVKSLVGSKMLNENALKEALNFFLSIGRFDNAKAIKEQYGVSLNCSKLKEQLLKAYESKKSTCELKRILSLYDKDNKPCIVTLREVLKTVATQPQDYSPELLGQNGSKFFDNYMEFINTLLSHGVEEQTAVDAAMTKAVSTLCYKGLKWAGQLKTEHKATMDPAKLKVAMDKAVDQHKLSRLEQIAPLFANGKDADAANIRVLEKLASKPDQYFDGNYRIAKNAWKEQLERTGRWSAGTVNTLIKRAIENRDISWANELNSKYSAYLDPETLKNYILKEAASVERLGHTKPHNLDGLITSLRFVKTDNPGLPNAIKAAVDQINKMEKFPLQQRIVDNLMVFLGNIHPSLIKF